MKGRARSEPSGFPDITEAFCHELTCRGSFPSTDALKALIAGRRKERVSHTAEYKARNGTMHLFVSLGSIAGDRMRFFLGMHAHSPAQSRPEKGGNTVKRFLAAVGTAAGPEQELTVMGEFRYPSDQHKLVLDLSGGMNEGETTNVSVTGIRLGFSSGPVESVIMDASDPKKIYVSLWSRLRAQPIAADLPAKCLKALTASAMTFVAPITSGRS